MVARNRVEELGVEVAETALFELGDHLEELAVNRRRLEALRAILAYQPVASCVLDQLIAGVNSDITRSENLRDLVLVLAIERFGWEHALPDVKARAEAALLTFQKRHRRSAS